MQPNPITISTTIQAPLQTVWDCWTQPDHITQWNAASADWHCPEATNDLRPGGAFSSTMAARDGSFRFDFGGVYDTVEQHRHIAYTLEDGRKVTVDFEEQADGATRVTEAFEPEATNPTDMQLAGWQAILDNFKQHAEGVK